MDVTQEKNLPSYKRKIGDITTTGINYENKITSLLYFRAMSKNYVFNIGTGVEDAGKFDDIVLRYDYEGKSVTFFLQLKHKENPRKNTKQEFSNFFSKKKCKESFSFLSYFTSFCNIKKNWKENDCNWWGKSENSYFVLFTNMVLSESEFSDYLEPYGSNDEDIINTGGCSYKLKSEVKDLIHNTNENIKHIEEFIHRFILYVNQPSEKDLENILKEEIIHCYKVSAHGASEIYTQMLEKIQNMRGKEYSEVLMRNEGIFPTGEQLRACINNRQQTKFDIYNIELNNECTCQVQKDISDSRNALNIILTSEIVLSFILVYRSLENSGDNPIIVSSETVFYEENYKKDVMIAWPNQWCQYLILFTEADDYNSLNKLENILENLLFTTNGKGKIILVIKSEAIKNIKTLYTCIKVPCGFKYLSDDCKKSIMYKEINFQGFIVKFGDIVKQEAENILNGPALNELILHDKNFPIGGDLKYRHPFFIKRSISHKIFIEKSILNEKTDHVFGITKMDPDDEKNYKPLKVNSLEPLRTFDVESDILSTFPFIGFAFANFEVFEFNEVHIRTILDSIEIINEFKHLQKMKNAGAFKKYMPTTNDATKSNSSNVHYISNREEFKALCDKYNGNVHWFIDVGNVFVWKESKGNLSIIYKYTTDEELVYKMNSIENIPGKIITLIADSGMGKSTLLHELAFHTKANDPKTFLIELNLPDSTNCLKNLQSQMHNIKYSDVLKILLYSYKSKDMVIWRRMCKYLLQSHEKIVVLIDSFDEICPEYGDIVSDLLAKITEMNIYKILVTSRQSTETILEETLKTTAFKLDPFDNKDQMLFFMNYLPYQNIDQNDVDKVIATFKDKTFLRIPLHCKLVAEIMQLHLENHTGNIESHIPEINDEIHLYETFIETKFQHYCKKYEIHTNNAYIFKLWRKEFTHIHTQAALMQIFYVLGNIRYSRYSVVFISTNEEFLTYIEEGKLNTELINFVKYGRPQFVHRKFAEFLTAKYLFDNYLERIDILQEILCKSNTYFIDLRHMLNLLFLKDFPLHSAVYGLKEEKVKDILLKKSELINTTDVLGRTPLHIVVCHRPYIFETSDIFISDAILIHLLKNNADLNAPDALCKFTPFQYLNVDLSWNTLEKLLETESVNEKHKIELWSTIWSREVCILNGALYAAEENSKVITNFLFKSCNLEDDKKELQKFVVSQMFIHSSSEFMEYLGETLEFDWNVELGLIGNILQFACLYENLNALQYLIQTCKISPEIQNSNVNTAIAIAAMQNNLKILQLFEEETEFRMSSFNDDEGKCLLHHTSTLDCTKYLVEKCNLNPRHASKLGMLPVHKAALYHKWDIVEYYIEQCKVPVNVTDTEGASILHYACLLECDINPFLTKYKESINLNLRDTRGMTPFILAVSCGVLNTAKCLADCSETDTNIQDSLGNTALHLAILGFISLNVNAVKFIVEKCRVNPSKRNNEDKTALAIAQKKYKQNNESIDHGVIEYLKAITKLQD